MLELYVRVLSNVLELSTKLHQTPNYWESTRRDPPPGLPHTGFRGLVLSRPLRGLCRD
ncbi:MAG: hypothetical protein LM571_06625 [Desulfurococcaceae archaeon]|nr:hypothetical protein [Desulfurococcaceae archaeon]